MTTKRNDNSPEEVFVYSIKVVLQFFVGVGSIRVVCGVMIYVREEDGLREWWLDVFSRAPIAVTAGSDLFHVGVSCMYSLRRGKIDLLCNRRNSLLCPVLWVRVSCCTKREGRAGRKLTCSEDRREMVSHSFRRLGLEERVKGLVEERLNKATQVTTGVIHSTHFLSRIVFLPWCLTKWRDPGRPRWIQIQLKRRLRNGNEKAQSLANMNANHLWVHLLS